MSHATTAGLRSGPCARQKNQQAWPMGHSLARERHGNSGPGSLPTSKQVPVVISATFDHRGAPGIGRAGQFPCVGALPVAAAPPLGLLRRRLSLRRPHHRSSCRVPPDADRSEGAMKDGASHRHRWTPISSVRRRSESPQPSTHQFQGRAAALVTRAVNQQRWFAHDGGGGGRELRGVRRGRPGGAKSELGTPRTQPPSLRRE